MDYSAVIDEFKAYARAVAPLEACGLVYIYKGRPRLHQCHNIAADPVSDFAIDPVDFARAEACGEVVGVVHSHPGGPDGPTLLDRSSHLGSGLDWWIYWWLDAGAEGVYHMPAVRIAPRFDGRVFVHGVVDCYTLIRDWYRAERSIELPDFARHDDWWLKGQNLYLEGFPQAGFTAVNDAMQPGDVLLMNIGAPVCNHAAIYCGGDKILHHLHGRLSSYDLYSGFYRDRTRYTLRYTGNQATG